jgi:hypothetical protein
LAIGLEVESSIFCDLIVQERLETQPKGVEEPVVSFEDDSLWYPKVDPHLFKEYLSSIIHCEILLTCSEDGHL